MAMNAHSNVGCFKKDTSQRDLCKMTLLPNVVYVTFNTATGTVSSKKKRHTRNFFVLPWPIYLHLILYILQLNMTARYMCKPYYGKHDFSPLSDCLCLIVIKPCLLHNINWPLQWRVFSQPKKSNWENLYFSYWDWSTT